VAGFDMSGGRICWGHPFDLIFLSCGLASLQSFMLNLGEKVHDENNSCDILPIGTAALIATNVGGCAE
jgi:hypothetical protein